uniref:Arrestin_N domain-containing protein n=1 Tax=Macrostomum lignano TaxID=282301 RepID=A0A1I8FKE6_9PLAT
LSNARRSLTWPESRPAPEDAVVPLQFKPRDLRLKSGLFHFEFRLNVLLAVRTPWPSSDVTSSVMTGQESHAMVDAYGNVRPGPDEVGRVLADHIGVGSLGSASATPRTRTSKRCRKLSGSASLDSGLLQPGGREPKRWETLSNSEQLADQISLIADFDQHQDPSVVEG